MNESDPTCVSASVISATPFTPKPSFVEKIYLSVVAILCAVQWYFSLSAMNGLTTADIFILLGISTVITAVTVFGSWWAIRRGLNIQRSAKVSSDSLKLENAVKAAGYNNVNMSHILTLLHEKVCITDGVEGTEVTLTLIANDSGEYDVFSSAATATEKQEVVESF